MSIWRKFFGRKAQAEDKVRDLQSSERCSGETTTVAPTETIWGLIESAPQPTSRRRSEQTKWIASALKDMGKARVEHLAAQFCESLRLGRTKQVWAGLKLFHLENEGLCIGGSLHDDCAWVMLHGRLIYEAFLANPDSLADLASIENEWDVHRGGYSFVSVFTNRLSDFELDESPAYKFEMSDADQNRFRKISPNKRDFPRLDKARKTYLSLPLFRYSGQPEGMRHEIGEVRARNRDEALAKLAEKKIQVDSISQV